MVPAAPVVWGVGASSDNTINVLMVNNPQMLALQKHIGEFTKESGITVNFTVKPENDMRNQAATEFANQSGQFDVATLSNFEIPFYSKNGWLTSMDDIPAYKSDTGFDQSDIFPSMTNSLKGPDGKLYGEPFYGESSFLMYRKDIAKKVGVKFSETPTWDEVAAAAAKMDGAESGMKGICLRGLPGWGEVFAPLTTVVNTYGGTWFDKNWDAQVNGQGFKDATNFYTNLVKSHGEAGAAQAGFAECLTATEQSKVAMWYDATSAAGSLEASDSPVKGKMGYVQAPVKETKTSGWLYTWSWAIEKKSQKSENAWKFISWASGKDYENLVGERRRLGHRARGQAGVDLRQRRLRQGGQGLRHADEDRDRRGEPDRSRHAAAADSRHPVRRHPRVHRLRHHDLPGRVGGHRRSEDRRRGAEQRSEARASRG